MRCWSAYKHNGLTNGEADARLIRVQDCCICWLIWQVDLVRPGGPSRVVKQCL